MKSFYNSPEYSCTPAVSRWPCLVLLTCLALCSPWQFVLAESDSPLKTFSAEYTVENDYITGGDATLSLLENNEGLFDFVLQTLPTGIFKWTGKGNIREHAILPNLTYPFESIRYNYTDKGDSDRNYQIDFNRNGSEFSITRNSQTAIESLKPGTLDRLSVTLVILHEIQQNPDLSTIEANILSGDQAQKIVFSNEGTETVETGLGEKEAIRIHKKREASNRRTIIWLAPVTPNGQVIPVKIEQFKRDKLTMRLMLTKFSAVE